MKAKILVVEDDANILLGLEEVLRSEGHAVTVCRRGDRALEAVQAHQPDLLILDVMLPGLNGYDVCRQLRSRDPALPVLMLTAKSQEMDKVIGLQLGADDYLTKPFGVRELIARIQALLRRRGHGRTGETKDPATSLENAPAEPFKIGSCVIDPRQFTVRRGPITEELTARELRVLQLLHGHPGEVFSRDRLLTEVWGYAYHGTTRTLDQVVVQLRRKLGDSGDRPRHLLTVHGVGYKLAR